MHAYKRELIVVTELENLKLYFIAIYPRRKLNGSTVSILAKVGIIMQPMYNISKKMI